MPSVNVFIAMGTQWRTGHSGATGLDYSALPVVMDGLQIAQSDRPVIFLDIILMESIALDTMSRRRAL